MDDGSNSPGGIPVLQAAAVDRRGGVKGGPYSEGAFPGAGQYATVAVQDDGGERLDVTLTGRRYTGEDIVRHTFSVPAGR